RRRALVEGGEPHEGDLRAPHLVDLVRRQARFDLKLVAVGHDFKNDVAGADHAADGMNGELMNRPGRRRANIDPLQLIRSCDVFDAICDSRPAICSLNWPILLCNSSVWPRRALARAVNWDFSEATSSAIPGSLMRAVKVSGIRSSAVPSRSALRRAARMRI